MLDAFRIWPHILARLRAGPLGPHLDGFVEALQTDGYTPRGIRRHLQAVDKFGGWLQHHRLRATEVDEATVALFVAGLGRYPWPSRPRGRLPDTAFGVRRLAAWLWQQGLAARRTAEPPITDAEHWLRSFDAHLDRVNGLAVGTRRLYLRYARAFGAMRFGAASPDWSRVRAAEVADFVRTQAARLKPSACRLPVTATRAVLRFLATTGAVRAGLEGAVPTLRQWKHAALPGPLTAPEVARVLAGCGGASAVRRRDRAIVLLLARLGLRAGEVAALGLDDFDWRAGHVRVRASKSGRERALPLPAEAGRALVAYLRRGRPRGSRRAVFLRARAPVRRLTASAVSSIAHRALARARVAVAPAGAHAFRHTAATEMVRRGATFKEVADVLGHAHLQTTAVYAKLDVEALARVALPWPGGAP